MPNVNLTNAEIRDLMGNLLLDLGTLQRLKAICADSDWGEYHNRVVKVEQRILDIVESIIGESE